MKRSGIFFRVSFFFLLAAALFSCSFNKVFLRPDKYPPGFKEMTIKAPDDTVKILYTGATHQPIFLRRNGRDTVKLNFSIESVLLRRKDGKLLMVGF